MNIRARYGHVYHSILPLHLRKAVFRIIHAQTCRDINRARKATESDWSLQPLDRHQCLFVHVPKTAGISITTALFGNLALAHTKLRVYQMVLTTEEFRRYFKFAFVRNPWDRLVSAYEYLKKGGRTAPDRAWSNRVLSQYASFDDFVRNWLSEQNSYSHFHFVPQWEYLTLGKRIGVDYLGYYETLHTDFARIRDRLQIEAALSHDNMTGNRGDYRNYYDDETQAIVRTVYRKDIELFGYDFESQFNPEAWRTQATCA